MAMEAQEIVRLIKDGIPGAEVTIEDLRGSGDHYSAHVVSTAFAGKSRVQQHQMVYQALQGNMGDALHALALQTSVPSGLTAARPKAPRSAWLIFAPAWSSILKSRFIPGGDEYPPREFGPKGIWPKGNLAQRKFSNE